jgi:phage terminase Nu1 subunit (DNA packaging protein)
MVLNAVRIAQLLNLSEQRIHQLVKVGMPREARGQYDAMKCMLWYVRYLQAVLEKRSASMSDGGYAGVREERVRLLRADADLKEMELAKERGRLVALPDVESALTDLFRTTESRIMAIPPRLAPELVGETSGVMVQAKLEKACKEALAYLAKAVNNGANADTPKRSS